MAKQAKVAVVSNKDEKLENRKKLADRLEAHLDTFTQEVSEKEYPVGGGVNTAKHLYNFVKNEAQWKFTEALGVMESARILKAKIDAMEAKTSTVKDLTLGALTIEALYYFMTKTEGTGLPKATSFVLNVFKPISDAFQSSKADRDKINQMQRDLGTLQDAILNRVGLDNEDALLKEIEEELQKKLESTEKENQTNE